MISKDIIPAIALQEYISHYRLRHFIFRNGITPAFKPFPPRPEQSLSFYIRGKETVEYVSNGTQLTKPRSVISGQFTTRVNRYVSIPEILMVIVDFKPGALNRLSGMHFSEFANKDIDAEAVFPGMREVNERLCNAESYAGIINTIESFCLDLLQRSKKIQLPLDHMLSTVAWEPDLNVDQLTKSSYLSVRQLERKFNERIGISPKTFLRVSQFNQSYWMRLRNPHLSWYDIAIACGYTDYQHLVKAYKEFANSTPNHLFLEEQQAPGKALGLSR